MTDKPHIEARENGPLVAKGIGRMAGPEGEEIEVKKVMALCRCGHSNSKPFCDGSHEKVGFDSAGGGAPAGKDRRLRYAGDKVTVTFNPMVCAHARECVRRAGHVFDPDKTPWVQPDEGSREEIEEVIASCPSGALAFERADGSAEHRKLERPHVTVEKDGPYWVQGVTAPAGLQGDGMTGEKYVLCRCGLSGNKPYCDGTHSDKGWKAE